MQENNTGSKFVFLGYLILAILITAIVLDVRRVEKIKSDPEKAKMARITVSYLDLIPDGLNNYKSKQLNSMQLSAMLRTGVIRRVIRLNGNGKDSGALTIQEEKAICEKFGVEFIFMNAHEGLKKGRGFTRSASQAHEILMEGNNLIHCKHGFHRVGAMVGYHLRQLGFEYDEVVAYNGWESFKIQDDNDQNYWDTIK